MASIRINLARGLRPSKRMPRNNEFLTTCNGAVARDGIMQVIDELTPFSTSPMEVTGTDALNYTCIKSHIAAADNKPITGGNHATYWSQTGSSGTTWVDGNAYSKGIDNGFPYPQIFVFIDFIIVCGEVDIFELESGVLEWKLTVTAGATWRALDFHEFVYMSNGKVAVERDPFTGRYALSTQPIASALGSYNGQVIIGAPGVSI